MSSSGSAATGSFLAHIEMEHLTELQAGLVVAVRTMETTGMVAAEGAEAVDAEAVRKEIADLYPPVVLLCPEMVRQPILHQQLLLWLVAHGVPAGGDASMRSLTRLAATLYVEQQDKVVAQHIFADMHRRSEQQCRFGDGRGTARVQAPAVPAVDDGASTGSGARGDADQLPVTAVPREEAAPDRRQSADNQAHRVSMRFKDNSAKFGGELTECWDDFVAEYDLVGRDYGLSASQKRQLLHNLLRGDAKRFFLTEVDPVVVTYIDAVARVRDEYHSQVRRHQAKNFLTSLRMRAFELKGMTLEEALTETYNAVMKTGKLLPDSHRGEAHRVEFLRRAVVGYEWATQPLSRISTHPLGFQALYGELQSALFLHQEARRAAVQDGMVDVKSPPADKMPSVLFQGQGRYAVRHSGLGSTGGGGKSMATPPRRFDTLSVAGCFNCDDRSHTIRSCPHPVNAAKAARNRVAYLAKRKDARPIVGQVLYELCSQLDASVPVGGDAGKNGDGESDKAAGDDLDAETLFLALTDQPYDQAGEAAADKDRDGSDFAPRD